MALKLFLHPLSSYCHKVLIALYENNTPFEPVFVDLSDPSAPATLEMKRLWPVGMFPVLQDEAAGRVIPESSIIIEYLDQHFPGETRFIPVPGKQVAWNVIVPPDGCDGRRVFGSDCAVLGSTTGSG